MTQTKGGETIRAKVIIGVALHFGSVILESLVWIENSGNKGVGKAFCKQASILVGNLAGYFLDGSTKIFEVSGPAVSLGHNILVQKLRFGEGLNGQFLKLVERCCAVHEDGLRALALRQEFSVFAFDGLPEQDQGKHRDENRSDSEQRSPVDTADAAHGGDNEQSEGQSPT